LSLKAKFCKNTGTFSLDVALECENDVCALFGESGSGKSMTLKCIAGVMKPDKGFIELDGRTFFDSERKINLSPQKRKTGYLFQNYALFPNMTVKENIACAMRSKDDKTINDTIIAFLLGGLENQYPASLSGGQQQRTALARIMVSKPDILLLDEPFSALDSNMKWSLEQEMCELIESFKKTVIFVSHDRNEVFDMAENICFIENGKTYGIQEKHSAFSSPDSSAAARLCGFRNIFAAEYKNGSVYIPALDITLSGGNEKTKLVAVKNNGFEVQSGTKFPVKRIMDGIEGKTVLLEGTYAVVSAKVSQTTLIKGDYADIKIKDDAVLFLER